VRGEQLARQWRILQYLSNNSRGRHIDQIANEVGCSPRNVRRDLLALQEAGFGLYTEKHGQTTLWKTSDAFSNNPPIPLTLMEIVALLLAETELRCGPDDFISQSFSNVTEKILKSRPPAFREQMELLQEKFYGASAGPEKSSRTAKDVYEVVSNAISSNWKISATYRNASGKRTVGRKLAPLHIWVANNSRYLVAFCYEKEQVRTFHLKRFLKVEVLPEKFENQWTFNMQQHAEETFGVFHAKPERITVWFDPMLRTYIEDHPLHQSQAIEAHESGLVVKLKVGINESLVSKLMSFGSLARVLSPDRLAIIIMERHRSAHEHYKAPMPATGSGLPLIFE
jgi:predicted DNA-binding transcriptional regulator YafY